MQELAQLRTGVEKQCADLRNEADKYAEEVLRRSDEQATATRKEIEAQQNKIAVAARDLDAAHAKVADAEQKVADATSVRRPPSGRPNGCSSVSPRCSRSWTASSCA